MPACDRVLRIEIDGALEHAAGIDSVRSTDGRTAGRAGSSRRLDVFGRGPLDGLFSPSLSTTQRAHDVAGNLVLDGEDVLELPVMAARPQAVAVGRADELGRDAQPVARLADAAFEHRPDTELPPDVADVALLALEGERRRARRDAERLDLRQRVDDVFGDAVAELSFSASVLMLTKGRTAIDLTGGAVVLMSAGVEVPLGQVSA